MIEENFQINEAINQGMAVKIEESPDISPEKGMRCCTENEVTGYNERYYLRYRDGKRSTALDLQGTGQFLKAIGFDGGFLRQAREGANNAEAFQSIKKGSDAHMRCSYCGEEIAGAEYFRLPDGRMRCTSCSNSIVKNQREAEALCSRVIANMEMFFGASINVSVNVELMDEVKLKKKAGIPLGTKDEKNMLVLGVALNNKKKYSILLENGAPRISVISTFVHELTHIWQYVYWDSNKTFRQCSPNKRLLVYEGMAKWAEIQYLYLIGETNVAKREENITQKRNDEYGEGFRLYEKQYPLSKDIMNCQSTPFITDRYPLE